MYVYLRAALSERFYLGIRTNTRESSIPEEIKSK